MRCRVVEGISGVLLQRCSGGRYCCPDGHQHGVAGGAEERADSRRPRQGAPRVREGARQARGPLVHPRQQLWWADVREARRSAVRRAQHRAGQGGCCHTVAMFVYMYASRLETPRSDGCVSGEFWRNFASRNTFVMYALSPCTFCIWTPR